MARWRLDGGAELTQGSPCLEGLRNEDVNRYALSCLAEILRMLKPTRQKSSCRRPFRAMRAHVIFFARLPIKPLSRGKGTHAAH